MSDFISVGHTQKSHGIKGEIKLKVDPDFIADVLAAEIIFIKHQGATLPFFSENIRGQGKFIIAKFEDVDSPEKADTISSSEIFLREEDIQVADEEEVEDSLVFGFLAGYELRDAELGTISIIKEVIPYPHQEMAAIVYKNKEILIPLNEHLIQSLDQENQVVHMNLPDGLLDL